MLINSAYQYTFGSPNNMTRERQGWGIPDLLKLYNSRFGLFIVNETTDLVGFGSSATYQVLAVGGIGNPLKVTMVFADPAAIPLAGANRVNDLNLLVTSPSGVTYRGNSGLAAGPWTTQPGSVDKKNVIENVFIETPAAGTWIIKVEVQLLAADGNPETPDTGYASWDVDFALVVSGLEPMAVQAPRVDWNRDGVVDSTDFVAFLTSFLDQSADVDGDGSTDSSDFFMFINAFFAR